MPPCPREIGNSPRPARECSQSDAAGFSGALIAAVAAAPQLVADEKPVATGQHEVEGDQSVRSFIEPQQRVVTVGTHVDNESLGFQPAPQRRRQPGVIVDQEQTSPTGSQVKLTTRRLSAIDAVQVGFSVKGA